VSCTVEPPNSLLLLVGREEFDPPFSDAEPPSLVRLGVFEVESEGQLSLRDIYNREYAAAGVEAGLLMVTVWGNDATEPSEVVFELRQWD
jgi:hypothetical protein